LLKLFVVVVSSFLRRRFVKLQIVGGVFSVDMGDSGSQQWTSKCSPGYDIQLHSSQGLGNMCGNAHGDIKHAVVVHHHLLCPPERDVEKESFFLDVTLPLSYSLSQPLTSCFSLSYWLLTMLFSSSYGLVPQMVNG
jgi:hypothetical protein